MNAHEDVVSHITSGTDVTNKGQGFGSLTDDEWAGEVSGKGFDKVRYSRRTKQGRTA